jgi:hypothetical protein
MRAVSPQLRDFKALADQLAATCRVCGRPSTRRIGLTGFCSKHKADADALMREEGLMFGAVRTADAAFARIDEAMRNRDICAKRAGNPAFGKKRQRR